MRMFAFNKFHAYLYHEMYMSGIQLCLVWFDESTHYLSTKRTKPHVVHSIIEVPCYPLNVGIALLPSCQKSAINILLSYGLDNLLINANISIML